MKTRHHTWGRLVNKIKQINKKNKTPKKRLVFHWGGCQNKNKLLSPKQMNAVIEDLLSACQEILENKLVEEIDYEVLMHFMTPELEEEWNTKYAEDLKNYPLLAGRHLTTIDKFRASKAWLEAEKEFDALRNNPLYPKGGTAPYSKDFDAAFKGDVDEYMRRLNKAENDRETVTDYYRLLGIDRCCWTPKKGSDEIHVFYAPREETLKIWKRIHDHAEAINSDGELLIDAQFSPELLNDKKNETEELISSSKDDCDNSKMELPTNPNPNQKKNVSILENEKFHETEQEFKTTQAQLESDENVEREPLHEPLIVQATDLKEIKNNGKGKVDELDLTASIKVATVSSDNLNKIETQQHQTETTAINPKDGTKEHSDELQVLQVKPIETASFDRNKKEAEPTIQPDTFESKKSNSDVKFEISPEDINREEAFLIKSVLKKLISKGKTQPAAKFVMGLAQEETKASLEVQPIKQTSNYSTKGTVLFMPASNPKGTDIATQNETNSPIQTIRIVRVNG